MLRSMGGCNEVNRGSFHQNLKKERKKERKKKEKENREVEIINL